MLRGPGGIVLGLLGSGGCGVEAVAMETSQVVARRWGWLLVVVVDLVGVNLLLWHPNLVVAMVT